MSITATVKDGMIALPEGINLADGTLVVVEALGPSHHAGPGSPGAELLRFAGIADDLPSDLARRHDAYVHGHSDDS